LVDGCSCSAATAACVVSNSSGTYWACHNDCASLVSLCSTTPVPEVSAEGDDTSDQLLPLWITLGILGAVALVCLLTALLVKSQTTGTGSIAPEPPQGRRHGFANPQYGGNSQYGTSPLARTTANPMYEGPDPCHPPNSPFYETFGSDSDEEV